MGRTDRLRILRKLTFKRAWNAVKVTSGYYYAKVTKRPVQWGLPVSISVEPTTSCNLRCPECPSGLRQFTRPTGMLKESFFHQTIDQLQEHLLYLTFYFQGEPYLNPQFLDMVKYAAARNIYTSTSTNAHFLDDENARKTVESGLDRIIISVDGTTPETYRIYRVGGSLEKVMEGTRNLVAWKKKLNSKTPHIVYQFLVVKPNEHQVKNIYELAEKLGVDEVKLKTAQVYDPRADHPLIPINEKYARYKTLADGTVVLKNELENHCWRLWHAAVITWDGAVVPCCFDKDAQHNMGDLKTKSFKAIWQSEVYQDFRRSVLRSRAETDICKNCSEGATVWA